MKAIQCPNCGSNDIVGDQCRHCLTLFSGVNIVKREFVPLIPFEKKPVIKEDKTSFDPVSVMAYIVIAALVLAPIAFGLFYLKDIQEQFTLIQNGDVDPSEFIGLLVPFAVSTLVVSSVFKMVRRIMYL